MLSAVKAGLVVGIPVALVGCADFTPRQVVEPSGVTLQAAIQDVQQSIVLLQKTPPEDRAGLMLDEVTVTFNVAASANAKNSGQINLSVNPNPAVTAGAMGSVELTNDANRGNTIVMKFKNLATADYSKGSFVTPGTGDYPGRIATSTSRSRTESKPAGTSGGAMAGTNSTIPNLGSSQPETKPPAPSNERPSYGPGSTGGGGRGTLEKALLQTAEWDASVFLSAATEGPA